jgi:hypothetical protein
MFSLEEMKHASDCFWHLHEWPGELELDRLRFLGRPGRQWSRRSSRRSLGCGEIRGGGHSIWLAARLGLKTDLQAHCIAWLDGLPGALSRSSRRRTCSAWLDEGLTGSQLCSAALRWTNRLDASRYSMANFQFAAGSEQAKTMMIFKLLANRSAHVTDQRVDRPCPLSRGK